MPTIASNVRGVDILGDCRRFSQNRSELTDIRDFRPLASEIKNARKIAVAGTGTLDVFRW